MAMLSGVLLIPAVLFVILIAPLWLVLHYRSKRQLGPSLSEQEHTRLTALLAQAEWLQQRVTTLERLLDVESPEWRQQDQESGS